MTSGKEGIVQMDRGSVWIISGAIILAAILHAMIVSDACRRIKRVEVKELEGNRYFSGSY